MKPRFFDAISYFVLNYMIIREFLVTIKLSIYFFIILCYNKLQGIFRRRCFVFNYKFVKGSRFMTSYVTYGKKRKTNKTSKLIFGVLALASLVLVLFMFIRYTDVLNLKKAVDKEIENLNSQTEYLTSQKQQKESELENLERQMGILEAEYASYQD